jgi:molybdenum cofactor cytidylyltransferase
VNRAHVSAILLAAGESRRMGGVNKLLLPIDGVPLVRRTAETLLATGIEDVVAALGFEADQVERALAGCRSASSRTTRSGRARRPRCERDFRRSGRNPTA